MSSKNINIDGRRSIPFMNLKGPGLITSVVMILLSFYFMFSNGFNFGVDFKGGYKMVFKFSEPVEEGKIRDVLGSLDMGDAQVVVFGDEGSNSYLIKAKFFEGRKVAQEIKSAFDAQLKPTTYEVLSEEMVGPKVGAELRKKGLFAVLLAWLLITVYVSWRFTIQFAPGALIALLHDLIITIGVFTFFGKEINLPILAAALTIVGYSVNDTIVIYDRIRENLKRFPTSISQIDIVNRSLTDTLSRTIVTSLTLLFAVGVLYVLGGGVLHDFAFCMIIGVIIGTYSSLFVASPIYLLFQKIFPAKGFEHD